ncbi:hypothetical protein L1987_09637 [Smallanthus sonchifolius]|uniref:Uncharacterized protein n=1 Tax=Smallanthus sonchifolius TaxID=185202 RepID=A0ACB9JPX3_9ASTR|nr:hypothetical protein L1987_09637 [Smallanthus sonchifolius]
MTHMCIETLIFFPCGSKPQSPFLAKKIRVASPLYSFALISHLAYGDPRFPLLQPPEVCSLVSRDCYSLQRYTATTTAATGYTAIPSFFIFCR